MEPIDDSEKLAGDFRALQILQLAFAAGQLIFAAVVFAVVKSDMRPFDLYDPMSMVAIVMTVILVPLAVYTNKQGIAKAKARSDFDSKMAVYRATFVRRTAFLEGCALYAIINVMINHCYAYYLFAAVSFTVYLALWVTLDKMKVDLDLY